jgi:3'(2'), 5'-bisphosphate nucleotidase
VLDRELVEAVRLARDAGALLMEVYATDFEVEYKGKSDPVTEADRIANELIVRRLRDTFPADAIIAEETAEEAELRPRGRCWFVDPLDGTKEFIAKNGEFSVMIGLVIDGDAKLGVVYQPVTDTLYRGVVGDSAFLEVGDRTYTLGVSSVAKREDLRLVVSRSHRSDSMDELVKRLGISNEAKSGSVGLKVGLIAEQKADLYVHASGKSSLWDACAPDAILRAAGGCFTDLAGRRFVYGGSTLRAEHGILASNAACFDEVAPIVAAFAREQGLVPALQEGEAEATSSTDPPDAPKSDAPKSDAPKSGAPKPDASKDE